MKQENLEPSVDDLKHEIAELLKECERLKREVALYRDGLRLMSRAEWKSRVLFHEAANALRIATSRPEKARHRLRITWFR